MDFPFPILPTLFSSFLFIFCHSLTLLCCLVSGSPFSFFKASVVALRGPTLRLGGFFKNVVVKPRGRFPRSALMGVQKSGWMGRMDVPG